MNRPRRNSTGGAQAAGALAALLAAVVAGPLRAEDEAIRKIVVLPFAVSSGVEEAQGKLLDDMYLGELSKRLPAGVSLIGTKDITNLLDHEGQKQLLGCSDSSCLVEIGNALGGSHLITSSVGKLGDRYVLNSTVLGVASARAVHRETLYIDGGDAALVPGIQTLVEHTVDSVGWRQGVAWAAGDEGPDAMLIAGAALGGVGLLAAAGFGVGALLIDQQLGPDPQGDTTDLAILGMGTLVGTGLGALAAIGGGLLMALAWPTGDEAAP